MGSVAAHVDSFLSAIDPEGGLVKLTETVADLAEANQDVRKSLTTVSKFIKTLPIDKEKRAKHKQFDTGFLKSMLPASSEGKTLLAAGFLKAKEGLRRITPQQLDKAHIRSQVLAAPEVLKKLEGNFVGELLIETDVRATRDARFAKQLAGALSEFEDLTPRLGSAAKRLHSVFEPGASAESSPGATAAAIIGDYDCGGGVGDALCAGALVVAIVIIIAVAK